MWYQRIEEIVEQPMSSNAAADDFTASITGKRKLEQSVAPEDNLSSFKRVRLLQRNYIVLPQLRSSTVTDTAVGNRGTEHPGRCHSCNRSETIEWRKGPDGEKTLCNICRLHYAKLTQKNITQQAAESESEFGDFDFDSDFATSKLVFSDENLTAAINILDQDAEIRMNVNPWSPANVSPMGGSLAGGQYMMEEERNLGSPPEIPQAETDVHIPNCWSDIVYTEKGWHWANDEEPGESLNSPELNTFPLYSPSRHYPSAEPYLLKLKDLLRTLPSDPTKSPQYTI